MSKQFFIFIMFLVLSFNSRASHIIGGEIYYDYLGGNNYRVFIALYRDCASTGAQYDDPLSLGVFNASNILINEILIPFPGSVNLPVVFNNPCVTPPSGICVERAIYSAVINLPAGAGYTLSYQRCCRGPNITNLVNPDDTGITLSCIIPPITNDTYINSSPRFTNYPPLVICNNQNLIFDHSATDPDGDVLTYELTTPDQGANGANPAPAPPPNPPYNGVVWDASFSATVPLGTGSLTTINPNTGQLFVDANGLGLFVVGIRVKETRNGVLINSTVRDFVFKVVNCVVQLEAILPTQENSAFFESYCQGLTWQFDNNSFGGSSYTWDFGVNGTNTDVSTLFEPTFTYPNPGIYTATFIVNPGWPCSDTTTVTLNLNNELQVDFNMNDSVCSVNNAIDFQAVLLVGNQIPTWSWNFGNASIPTAVGATVNNVNFPQAQGNEVTLIGSFGVCLDTVVKSVLLYETPTSDVEFTANHNCEGFTQNFINNSQNAGNYFWDFGVQGISTDQSTLTSPTYTFPSAGTYNITLIAEILAGCADTVVVPITIYEPLIVNFTHQDSLCIVDNEVDFDGTVSGPLSTTISWNFGNNALPVSATTEDVNNVEYQTSGPHPVTLSASFLNCTETASSSVFIYKEPTIGFTADSTGCAPHEVNFINLSSADSPIFSTWTFGTGDGSNQNAPSYTYQNPGQYSVNLSIITNEGCIDTLNLLKTGFITIYPSPISSFISDIVKTDICASEVNFLDQSTGATNYFYDFDDETNTSNVKNPTYVFQTDGTHWVTQIVSNEFNCKDTSRVSIEIEPFPLYVPNAFTPDGNKFNNDFSAVLPLEPETFLFRIYNRWGEIIYESEDYKEKWDGKFKDEIVQDGLYTWVIKFTSCAPNSEEETISGHVTLIR